MQSRLSPPSKIRIGLTHALRIGTLCGILALIHAIHDQTKASMDRQTLEDTLRDRLKAVYGQESQLGERNGDGIWDVLSRDGERLGSIFQTSPSSDSVIGFSGPTNLMVALDVDDRIRSVEIFSSRDTRDHVRLVADDPQFFSGWKGESLAEVRGDANKPNVAGATLTSMAIVQGLQRRLGIALVDTKFPFPLTVEDAISFFPNAASVTCDKTLSSLWHVAGSDGQRVGWLLRTSPVADSIVGYQGPSDACIAVKLDGEILGYRLGQSFDNEPYVGYVRRDRAFQALLKKYRLAQLGELDLRSEGIEGVSGATMTSMAMVQGLVRTARELESARELQKQSGFGWIRSLPNHLGTLVVVSVGVAMGLGRLRVSKWGKLFFQIVVISYLGFWNGHVLSIAMFAGWTQSGIPWQNAVGLCILSFTAVALPITTKRNVYCSHLCPHGAIQQWLPRKWRWRQPMPMWLRHGLVWIRPVLFVWVLAVLLVPLGFSLVDIEPFDAYVWRAAAIPSVVVALVGIGFSFLVPMGYCQHGCVTGGLLQYVRRHAQSHRIGLADYFAISSLVACFLVYLWHGF